MHLRSLSLLLVALVVPALAFAPGSSFPKPTTSTTTSRSVQSSFSPPRQSSALASTRGIEVAGLLYDSTSTAFDAWEWTNGMGAPAALIAGAVLVTLCESREFTSPRKKDTRSTRLLKLSMRFLLCSSFLFEVVAIFVGTMTGTLLLGRGEQAIASKIVGYQSGLQLLHHHHEFEFLTTQIFFLQGLFNWLAAVAVELVLPKKRETNSARRMNRCLAAWLTTMIVWMLAFYNHHLSFYADYATMLWRWGGLFIKQYFLEWPVRPMSFVYVPSIGYSLWLTWKAFRDDHEQDEELLDEV